jgi:hypothetical protein
MRRILRTAWVAFTLVLLFVAASIDAVAQYQEQDWAARHAKEDREWARKTGLSAAEVRDLRLLADVPDDSDTLIDNLIVKGLRARNHILLVTTSGNGHCLDLFVFLRKGNEFERVWAEGEMPDGGGFCRASPYNPVAYVTRRGKIVVKVPVYDYSKGKPKAPYYYAFVWNGKTYKSVGGKV